MRVGAGRFACFLIGLSLLAAGCATRINSEEQLVLISSKPLGAKVTVDDRFVLTTPGRVHLHRMGDHTILVEKEGYEPQVITTERVMSKMVFLDVLCIPFWWHCIEKDLREGGWYRFQDEYHVALTRRPDPEVQEESPPAIPTPTSPTPPASSPQE
jgi:hypothetical protein